MWPIWKKTVNTHYMNIERREIVNRKDKIMFVTFLNSQFDKAIVQFYRGHNDTFLNSQFEKAIVQFFRGHNDNEQY